LALKKSSRDPTTALSCLGDAAIAAPVLLVWRIGRSGRGRVRIRHSAQVEALVCELRRAHPELGA
jgi:hypothetical protein